MESTDTGRWLVLAVALGLFAFGFTAIFVNGFQPYMLYTILLGIVNLFALFLMRKNSLGCNPIRCA